MTTDDVGTSARELRELATRWAAERDADARKFEKLRKDIAHLRSKGAAAFDELYEAVAVAYQGDPPLWRVKYGTERAFLAAELPGEDKRSVRRNVLVAVCFTPEDEAKHGIAFLEEAALYAQAKAGARWLPAAIDLDRLRVPVERDGQKRTVTARKATREELTVARKKLSPRVRDKTSPPVRALRAAFAKVPALATIVAGGTEESVRLDRVPVAALDALGRALREVAKELRTGTAAGRRPAKRGRPGDEQGITKRLR